MPEHTSFFSYLLAMFPALGENVKNLGHSLAGKPVTTHSIEPLLASAFIMVLIIALAAMVKPKVEKREEAVLPENKLTLRTFFEVLIGSLYDMMKDMMGPARAKRYFPLVGTAGCFIFFANFIGMIPGFSPPTSSWNITLGCAIVVFVLFNYYGIKENGIGYFKHLAGPWLGPLGLPLNIALFFIELIALFLRPVTLSIRLMLNMAVDHLLLSIVLSMVMLLLPIPIMILGTLVAIVQVVVFCLLTSIYITLATEHEDHGDGGHGAGHGHGDKAAAAHGTAAH